jgi:hypothetical protein
MSAPEGARYIKWAIGGFVVTCVLFFFLGGLMKPRVDPGFQPVTTAQAKPDGTFVITIDAQDTNRWAAFSFGEGKVGTAQGDVLVQRSLVQAPFGAIDLGSVKLEEAVLPASPGWKKDEIVEGVPQNPAIARWYEYSYFSHLLRPKGHTYAVQRADGGVAFFRVLSYYCAPEGAACLTLQYRLQQAPSPTSSPGT